jgi:tRNA-dihydrouridine synthase 2
MGAALLTNLETAVDIVKTLRRNLNIPVSCKIRMLDETPKTLHLMKALEMAGACAIAVHMRSSF